MAEEILENELENEEEIVLENEAAEDDLQAKVDALIKEKDGLYKEMIAERRTRQELKSQSQALQEQFETVKQVLSEIKESKTSGKQKGSGIKLKYDDDGDPYIDPKDLEGFIAPVKERIEAVQGDSISQSIQLENTKRINTVLQSDPAYAEGYRAVQEAWGFLDGEFNKYVIQNGIDPKTLTLESALEMIESGEIGQSFADKFPGLDIDTVSDAFTVGSDGLVNTRKLKKAVRLASPKKNQKMDNLKFVAGKPNNLATQPNRKGGSGRTLDDLADISVDDFMNLSDADVAKLERALGT